MSSRLRKQLRDKISRLSFTEHEEIFKILEEHNINFTQNKNGTFFDISIIPEEAFIILDNFVNFCISNKHDLDEYDKKINECKLNNNYDKLQKTSTSLCNVINSEEVDDWQEILNENKNNDKVMAFVNILENTDRLSIKKTNTKFLNTKKKYSKKLVSEKKGETELPNVLDKENYI